MARPKTKVDVRKIVLDLIDQPKMLVREDIGDMEEIKELGRSIKESGQIQPVVLRKAGERFEVVAGARRIQASRIVGLETIEAKIIEVGDAEAVIMRWSENDKRLQNSPIEEALFLREMLEKLGCSQVELSRKIQKSAAYVSQRMSILDGYECVREALRSQKITFNQARELMLFPDERQAQYYCEITIKTGATTRLISQWRSDLVTQMASAEMEKAGEGAEVEMQEPTHLRMFYCEFCRAAHYPQDLVYIRLCHPCEHIIKSEAQKAQNSVKGGKD